MKKTNIGVLISGGGTNLQALINAAKKDLPVDIKCVISNKSNAYGLKRAERSNIPSYLIPAGKDREEHEKRIAKILEMCGVELIVLAGYMRLLTPYIINLYPNRIINIHPALLPSFPGTHGYEDAWNYGVKVSGCTTHFVDKGCDTGAIILQGINKVRPWDTLDSFKKRGLIIEHKTLVTTIDLYATGRLKVEGRKVIIYPIIDFSTNKDAMEINIRQTKDAFVRGF